MEPLSPEQMRKIRRQVRNVKAIRTKAKWTIKITDEAHGDSLQLKLYRLPWPGRYVDSDGREWSPAKLGKLVAVIAGEAS